MRLASFPGGECRSMVLLLTGLSWGGRRVRCGGETRARGATAKNTRARGVSLGLICSGLRFVPAALTSKGTLLLPVSSASKCWLEPTPSRTPPPSTLSHPHFLFWPKVKVVEKAGKLPLLLSRCKAVEVELVVGSDGASFLQARRR